MGGRGRILIPMHPYFKFLRPEFPDHPCVSVFLSGISSVRRAPFRPEVLNAAKRRRPGGARVPCGEARAAASRDRAGQRAGGWSAELPVPGGAWKRVSVHGSQPPLPASPPAAAGPRTVRRGARTQGAGLPAARGKVELGEVGSGGSAPRGGH